MPISRDRILYQDDHLLAVNKLSGELVVKGKGEVGKLPLLDFLKKDYPGLRTLHRLDFETSGVVVFARTKQVYGKVMESGFSGWKKVYCTLVVGRMERERGEVRAPLPARSGKGTVEAVTRYTVLDRFANSSFVEAEIETGRHHQIRRHFASIGHPLALDHVYGNEKFNRVFTQEFRYRKFFLHAARVELLHPITGERIVIEAPLPKTFEKMIKTLKSL
ncbi:hypothetical protein A2454_02195 [Candidatus Peribacteria bacterium RIFOXYC2_FULL_55_14]|nr:MAG: hypothetical protein A2198_05600 [Candidatus Peribacteria bacterium RIFOXYA1_FULL_56_14]OGJ74403.1 MAG: hypothetical protein A2384_06810 [Candidatus Peribacteria bacterium RIFOXYB1_FULL_54_35]OGJ75062.1 MAG: hypothetical protein A2217_04995 [Candidatus Peribacteria bacterium RIFOXYA2_FULL_55_28]OGJ76022.1 MAG: hypothetical protein A2327_03955 [Candidatus Peribacteria bacterium RIFOXYB2_FULL_54_17]OGJ77512.1 MAG: hypothetical protein A2424_04150 [Candidatus Peribacteria bacterium RIFOXYC